MPPGQPRSCENCGWQWFHLRDPDVAGGAAVTVDSEGQINGYTGGVFECHRCGEQLDAVDASFVWKVVE